MIDREPMWNEARCEEIKKWEQENREREYETKQSDSGLERLVFATKRMARKTAQWLLDKKGFDADYSPYDAEGRPEERDGI